MEHITAIIASGEFTKFLGTPEDAVLEVKRQPYDLMRLTNRHQQVAFADEHDAR